MFPHVIPNDQDLIDYVEGARRLRDVNVISLDEWEKWSSQLREAMEYLHEKGFVWGDAKAASVLVGKDGNAILIDFGGGYTSGWVDQI
jgi:serine/threonine protein kinase